MTGNESSFWEQPGRGEEMEKDHAFAVETLLAGIKLDQSGTVLDVGCGNGWLLRRLSPYIGYGFGIDKSSAMIEGAQRLKGDLGNLEYKVGEWEDLSDYPRNLFEFAFGIESIYWTPVQENINRIHRVLKPGGTLGLTVEYYTENKDCYGWPQEVGAPMHLHSTREYAKMLQRVGFRDIKISRAIGTRDLLGTSEEFGCRYGTLVITALK